MSAKRIVEDYTFDRMVDELGHSNVARRVAACGRLAELGDARAAEHLIPQLGHWHAEVRAAAAEALTELGEADLVSAVVGSVEGDGDALADLKAMGEDGDFRAAAALVARRHSATEREWAGIRRALRWLYGDDHAGRRNGYCRTCLARFEVKGVASHFFGSVPVVACRACGKSSEGMFGVKEAVAVLDADMEEEVVFRQGKVRVNWLKRRELFDFDSVSIVSASDRDVEQFCIQVGNDTDEFRCHEYRKMICRVSRSAGLGEPSLSMLASTFGEVRVEVVAKNGGTRHHSRSRVHPEDLDRLLADLGHEGSEERVRACRKLGELGDRAATEHLVPLLGDWSPDIRQVAGQVLIELGERGTVGLVERVCRGEREVHAELESLRDRGELGLLDFLLAELPGAGLSCISHKSRARVPRSG